MTQISSEEWTQFIIYLGITYAGMWVMFLIAWGAFHGNASIWARWSTFVPLFILAIVLMFIWPPLMVKNQGFTLFTLIILLIVFIIGIIAFTSYYTVKPKIKTAPSTARKGN